MNNLPQFTGDHLSDPHLNLPPSSPHDGNDWNSSEQPNWLASERRFERLHPSRKTPLILVVDDDYRLTNTVGGLLEQNGFDVLKAFHGDAGLALAIVKHPDLMILDSRMPRRSGYLVLEHMRTEEDLLTPVIMLSENEGERHRRYAEMLGVIEHVSKPVDANHLVSMVCRGFQMV